MAGLADLVTPRVGERPTPLFLTLLVVHVGAGLTCVLVGAVAALSEKRPGRHPIFGTIFFWALLVVFASSTGMSS